MCAGGCSHREPISSADVAVMRLLIEDMRTSSDTFWSAPSSNGLVIVI
jgi:hypothetical protein